MTTPNIVLLTQALTTINHGEKGTCLTGHCERQATAILALIERKP